MTGHIIVGTAGHVDHGKTLLTAALTGVDADRLPEEKRRGMTIVPGYVQLDLENGAKIGMVDVPGHEKFIKSMLAGVGGIDMALLVVAADEGVMPQTVEHVNILHLLGIKKAVVAVTKCDMVENEPEWLDMVHEQIRELLQTTAFFDAPMVDVSAMTGQNIDLLRTTLGRVAEEIKERPHVGIARLPVDRVFTKAGFGTIVTGTLWAGSIAVGQQLELLPCGYPLRVRGLQVHNLPVERALAGQRTAVNLAGADAEKLKPGCWIADPGLLKPSYRMDVGLDVLKDAPKLKHRVRVHVFHGTKEISGRIRLLDREELAAGESCCCQIELEEALPALRGDRLILRRWSPEVTVAGATVLDPEAPRYRLSSEQTMPSITRKAGRDNAQILLDLLDTECRVMSLKNIIKAAQMPEKPAKEALAALVHSQRGIQIEGEDLYASAEVYEQWREAMVQSLAVFHKKYPLRYGASEAELRQKIFSRMEPRYISLLVERMERECVIRRKDGLAALTGFECVPTDAQREKLERITATYLKKLFIPPDWAELMAGFRIPAAEGQEYLIYLLDRGEIVSIESDYFHRSAAQKAADLLREQYPQGFTVAQARDVLGTTRRYALPILAELDRLGITHRDGDIRTFDSCQ